MRNSEPEPIEVLLIIAVGALIVEQTARKRQMILARIERAVGDPTIVPIHDGDALRMSVEMRRLFEQLLPGWLTP